MPTIRPSQPRDIPQIVNIYAHHVLTGTGTFEVTPPSLGEMEGRRAEVLDRGLPFLVAVQGTEVLGFAYCNWFKPRPAYRFSAEDSIYMDTRAQGLGIGRALLAELALQAEHAGVRKMIAVIGDSANAGSVAIHRSVGFAPVGVLKSCGWKFDRWLDVVLMDKPLGLGAEIAPC